MHVATQRAEVGVRDLKNNLSRHLKDVREGAEVIVTDRGVPVARLSGLDPSTGRLAELIAAGVVHAPADASTHALPRPIKAKGTVSDLVDAQRG